MSTPKRPAPQVLTVTSARHLTPNMIRVTLTGPGLAEMREGCEGANCKLLFPAPGQSADDFAEQLANGPRPTVRTYTIRHLRKDTLQLDIDFVAHGDEGPASAWALNAAPGDVIGFAGPGPNKVTHFEADWYLVAADMSALPVAAATLEQMPRDARGVAVFEITSPDDRQAIDAPDGIEMHWLVHADPHLPSIAQETFIRRLPWPEGRVQTCIAGESGVIRSLREYLAKEKRLPREDTYISGYWKIGLVEDEHQKVKRAESA